MKFKLKSPVAILGYGVEGRFALEFLRKSGIYDITICDHKENILIPARIKSRLGQSAFDDLAGFKTVIRSPGVHYQLPAIQKALKRRAHVTSLTALSMELAAHRITAITGSNGKTTTTALTAHILHAHYKNQIIIGGNDGMPVLKDAIAHPDWPILIETSSFQFADLSISPHISAVLNITPNHLDWHEDWEDYIRGKENLLRHQTSVDWALLNANNEKTARLCGSTPGQIFWIGKQKGKNWAVWRGPWLTVRHAGKTSRILSRKTLQLKTHPDNLLFAAAIATLHEAPPKLITEQMKSFTGVPHRLEFVRTIKDIHFFNDSSCTTPESAIVAIDQFDPKSLILILGGSSKKSDFSTLAAKIAASGVRTYLYGQEGERIKAALEQAGGGHLVLTYNKSDDFRQIVQDVYSRAKPGDSIVLSPACASFDMFRNAKERGYLFTEFVNAL